MYCWEAAKNHKLRSLNYCFFANQWVLFFKMPFLPYKGFALTGRLKTAVEFVLLLNMKRLVILK